MLALMVDPADKTGQSRLSDERDLRALFLLREERTFGGEGGRSNVSTGKGAVLVAK